MNRYLIVDFKEKAILNLEKINYEFEENEQQTSSISCIDNEDLLKELEKIVQDLKEVLKK